MSLIRPISYKRHILGMLAMGVLLGAVSCHHKSDSETTPSLSGTLLFSIPDYVNPGDEFTLVPSGIYRTDGGSYGFYWTASPYLTARDTTRHEDDPSSVTGEWTLTIPDALETLSVSCTAFASGYYSSSRTKSVVIVKPGETLTGYELPEAAFTDDRDGKSYTYSVVGSLDWMAENLSWEGSGRPFDDCKAMQDVFGGFYTWNEASEACPDGWRVPAAADWSDLAATQGITESEDRTFPGLAGSLMADAYFNGTKYWEYWPAVKITNACGFYAYPSGYAIQGQDKVTAWDGSGSYAAYWTAEEDGDMAAYRYIYVSQPAVYLAQGDKDSLRLPLRCVRDSE